MDRITVVSNWKTALGAGVGPRIERSSRLKSSITSARERAAGERFAMRRSALSPFSCRTQQVQER